MSNDKPEKTKRRKWRWIAGFVVFAALFGAVGIPYIYIHFINNPAPKLSFEQRDKELAAAAAAATAASSDISAATAASSDISAATAASSDISAAVVASTDITAASTSAAAASTDGVDGTWNIVSPSTAGYRVKEVLNGQSTEAVGRTSGVEGTVTISGTSVAAVDLSVDMTTLVSNESRRDDAFRGRIMNTEEFPVVLFSLTEPIVLGTIPDVGATATATAKGTLTMHGVEKAVEVAVTARRSASTIEVLGTIPIAFADYGVANPSIGFVKTADTGVIEFLLTLGKS